MLDSTIPELDEWIAQQLKWSEAFEALRRFETVKIRIDKKIAKSELNKREYALLKKKIRRANKIKDMLFRMTKKGS